MKKSLLSLSFFLITLFASTSTEAQNLQVHYDFERECVTSTLEMFKPDKYGNTYFFVDMDHGSNGVEGTSLAYMEISRVFKTDKMPIGIHAEYDGGLLRSGTNGFEINNAWLAGIDYSINAEDFSKGITFKALYKYIQGKHDASYQFTTVWYWNFLDNKITFSGFADFWREDNIYFDGSDDTKFVFLSEPQLWYNINSNISVGGEVEFSSNFGGTHGFKTRPTLAAKWIF